MSLNLKALSQPFKFHTNMENSNNNSELDLMRQQMSAFKQQLEQQEVVNDRLLTESMKKKMSWIKMYIIAEIIILPLIWLVLIGMKSVFDLTWWSVGAMAFMCTFDVWYDYHINIQCMKNTDYNRDNLLYTTQKLLDMKQRRAVQMGISVPMLIVVVVCIGFDFNGGSKADDMEAVATTIGGGVGAVIGIIIAYFIYRKMQSTNDELIEQIDELTAE